MAPRCHYVSINIPRSRSSQKSEILQALSISEKGSSIYIHTFSLFFSCPACTTLLSCSLPCIENRTQDLTFKSAFILIPPNQKQLKSYQSSLYYFLILSCLHVCCNICMYNVQKHVYDILNSVIVS